MTCSEHIWSSVHGPPRYLSAELEFFNKLTREANCYGIAFKLASATCHNKLGVAERKNSVVRLLVQRLFHDASYDAEAHSASVTEDEVPPRAAFLSNFFYGCKVLSSFKLALGYAPAISRLPKSRILQELLQMVREETARRAMKTPESPRITQLLTLESFRDGDLVYSFWRGPNLGTWDQAVVEGIND